MTNGSIMELVAKGKLDEDIIDINNKTSLFNYDILKKNKYTKGDTIFYPEGKATWGNTIRFNIERAGDLLYGLYLVIKLPKLSIQNLNTPIQQDEYNPDSNYRIKYSDYIGNILVEKASLYINDQLIDEQFGEYMQLYIDLYMSDWNRKTMLGTDDNMNKPNLKIESEKIYIPLKFWFCKYNNNPLPIIALQNSNIYIDIKFRNFSNCIIILEYDKTRTKLCHSIYTHTEVSIEDAFLQANFYYLDLEERKEMASREYEILITQSQVKTTILSSNAILEIDFNHIVKDLFFFIQPITHKENGEFFNFSAKMNYMPYELNNINTKNDLWNLEPTRHLLSRARILFNGIERIDWRDYKYFYLMQNHENYQNNLESYIYMYSFNIDPKRRNNNSGCNFSRLDNAQLQVEIKPNSFIVNNTTNPILKYPIDNSYELKCYATNYNILVIKNGLVGVKYSN
jgi:hypothetical protein